MQNKQKSECTSFFATIINKINYFGDNSALHGVRHIFSMSYIPFLKRVFWLVIVTSCCFGAWAILRAVLSIYTQGAVSYSVETNYLTWDTPFPAITICESADYDRVKNYLIASKLPVTLNSFFREVAYYNVKYCRTCSSCKMNVTCLENFQELVQQYRFTCPEMLSECWWDDQQFPCCQKFQPIDTEYGKCFVYNSRWTGNDSILTVNRQVGLPTLTITATQSVFMSVHSPDDIVSVKMENVLGVGSMMPMVTNCNASLKAEQTISEISVRALSSVTRGCLYQEERPAFATLWPYQRYSYSSCLMYCRTVIQAEACNCTHHFMPKLKGIDVCDIEGQACLYKHKEILLTNLNCGCPMSCEEIDYKAVSVTNTRNKQQTNQSSKAQFRLIMLPALRVRRHAIRDMMGLVVDIGGVGGVFFGASLLSVFEIIYLFCIRRGP